MPKSLIAQRREEGAVCPKCGSPDYHLDMEGQYTNRPHFICRGCGDRWSKGNSGGVYKQLLTRPTEKQEVSK